MGLKLFFPCRYRAVVKRDGQEGGVPVCAYPGRERPKRRLSLVEPNANLPVCDARDVEQERDCVYDVSSRERK